MYNIVDKEVVYHFFLEIFFCFSVHRDVYAVFQFIAFISISLLGMQFSRGDGTQTICITIDQPFFPKLEGGRQK